MEKEIYVITQGEGKKERYVGFVESESQAYKFALSKNVGLCEYDPNYYHVTRVNDLKLPNLDNVRLKCLYTVIIRWTENDMPSNLNNAEISREFYIGKERRTKTLYQSSEYSGWFKLEISASSKREALLVTNSYWQQFLDYYKISKSVEKSMRKLHVAGYVHLH